MWKSGGGGALCGGREGISLDWGGVCGGFGGVKTYPRFVKLVERVMLSLAWIRSVGVVAAGCA